MVGKDTGNSVVAWQPDGDVQPVTSQCEQTDSNSQELDSNYISLLGDHLNLNERLVWRERERGGCLLQLRRGVGFAASKCGLLPVPHKGRYLSHPPQKQQLLALH